MGKIKFTVLLPDISCMNQRPVKPPPLPKQNSSIMRKLAPVGQSNAMGSANGGRKDYSAEFQNRRKRYFSSLKKFAFFALTIGLACGYMGFSSKNEDFYFGSFASFFFSIVFFVLQTYRVYRCPGCDTVPMRRVVGRYGVDLSPRECRKCHGLLASPDAAEYNAFHGAVGKFLLIASIGCFAGSAYFTHWNFKAITEGTPVELKIIKRRGKGKAAKLRYKFSYKQPTTNEEKTFWIRGGIRSQSIGKRKVGEVIPGLLYSGDAYLNNLFNLWLIPSFLLIFSVMTGYIGREFIRNASE